jgi:hypothetical protein
MSGAAPVRDRAGADPSSLLAIFERAAGGYQLGPGGWAYLAAINEIESNFDQSTLPGVHSGTNPDGAAGPMQIGIRGAAGNTWAGHHVDAPGGAIPRDGPTSIPTTASLASARRSGLRYGNPSTQMSAKYRKRPRTSSRLMPTRTTRRPSR